jgi:signal transduction histidine kinase
VKFEPITNETLLINADIGRITQIVNNLLNNAAKFTKKGSIILSTQIKKDNHNNEVVISIKDSGSGIDSEILPKLFSKFATKSEQGALYFQKYRGSTWWKNMG